MQYQPTNTTAPTAPQRRILLFDDDPQTINMVRAYFTAQGFTVVDCSDMESFFNHDLTRFEMMIVDLNTDANIGLNMVENLKQATTRNRLAIVAMSVNMSPSTIIAALNAGADDYLLKPFTITELASRTRALLAK